MNIKTFEQFGHETQMDVRIKYNDEIVTNVYKLKDGKQGKDIIDDLDTQTLQEIDKVYANLLKPGKKGTADIKIDL